MCQIFFCPRDTPPKGVLKEANECNPHGIGYAWVEDGRVLWSKGFSNEQVELAAEEFESKPFPKAIHFRYATHGGQSLEMTHPFNITKLSAPALTGRSNSVLFHNGVWTDYDGLLIKGIVGGTIPKKVMTTPMSDSRAMAVLAGNFGEGFLELLDFSGEKVLVLKGDGGYYTFGTWYDGPEVDDDVQWYHSNYILTKHQKSEKKRKQHRWGGHGSDYKSSHSSSGTDTTVHDTSHHPKDGDNRVIPFKDTSAYPRVGTGSYLSLEREDVEKALEEWREEANQDVN